jgi:hypothetical protein
MQPSENGAQRRDRPAPVGEDSPFHPRQGLLARAHALAEQIRERVRRILDEQESGRAPPGTSEPPPSLA